MTLFPETPLRPDAAPYRRTARISLVALIARGVRALREAHRRRRDYERLRHMPDYLLDDIGVSRDTLADRLGDRRP